MRSVMSGQQNTPQRPAGSVSQLPRVELLAVDPESKIVSDGTRAVSSHARSKHLLKGMLDHSPNPDLE